MTHSTHAHSAQAEEARASRPSAVIRVRAETAAIMIALRCRPTRVSCRLAYVEATPNACGTRWGPHGTPSESRRRGRVGCHEGPESSDPEAAAARCPDLGTPRADILRCLLGGAAGGLRHPLPDVLSS